MITRSPSGCSGWRFWLRASLELLVISALVAAFVLALVWLGYHIHAA